MVPVSALTLCQSCIKFIIGVLKVLIDDPEVRKRVGKGTKRFAFTREQGLIIKHLIGVDHRDHL